MNPSTSIPRSNNTALQSESWPENYVVGVPAALHSADRPEPLPEVRYLLLIFKRAWKLLAFAVLLGAVLGFLATVVRKPIYEATTTLELQDTNADFLNLRTVDPNASTSPVTVDKYVDTQVKVIQSRRLIEKVLEKYPPSEPEPGTLAKILGFANLDKLRWRDHLPQKLRHWFGTVSPREAQIQDARDSLKVASSTTARTVDITYSSTDPVATATFANSVAAEYIAQNADFRRLSAKNTDQFLTQRLDDFRVHLEQNEQQLEAYSHSNGLLLTAEKDNVAEEKLRQIQVELSKAHADRVALQARAETAASAEADSVPEVLDNKTLTDYQARLVDLKRQKAELETIYTPAHHKVLRLQAQIDEMNRSISRDRTNVVQRVRNEYEAAVRREDLLRDAYTAQLAVVGNQSSKAVHYKMLKRDVDTNREIYEDMLKKAQDAGVVSALRATTVRVIDPAVPPTSPSKPRLAVNLLVGAFSGLWLGMLFVFVRERSNQKFREPGDTAAALDAPELGVIPSAGVLVRRKPKPARFLGGGGLSQAIKPVVGRGGEGNAIELLTWTEKPSIVAESFRAVLASLEFVRRENGRKAIVVTSPSPGDGKTTVLTNLGIALAEIGEKVLLIDCDLRKPRLHTVFSLPNTWGVTDVLSGQKAFTDLPASALVRSTSIPGLSVLPSGPGTANVSGVLNSRLIDAMLAHFSQSFDAILIDAPPMGYLADARILAHKACGVVLVLKANHTNRDLALAVSRRLKADGSQLIGTILNDWDPARSTHSYYDGYAYDGQS